MFRMLFAGLLSALVLGLLALIGLSTYHVPIKSAIVFGSLVGFILVVIGCTAVAVYLDDLKKANADKPDSLFVQKYKAHKAKICPSVEFKE
jgi:ascorbate-specific PTS system EIIC-type component UlaA